MRIEQTSTEGCAIVALHGYLDLAAVPRLRCVLRKRLAEQPTAVICDLSDLHGLEPACASVFSSAATHPSTSWPATSFLLCGAQPEVAATLGRLRVPQVLPMHPTVEAALAHAGSRPPFLREELALASSLATPAAARRFVRDLLASWRVHELDGSGEPPGGGWSDDVVDRAVLLASELVTNAVVHAASAPGAASRELRLMVELRGRQLRLAVRDPAARPLFLAPFPVPDVEAEGGRGLLLVERLAFSWGAHALASGGKVIWCILRF